MPTADSRTTVEGYLRQLGIAGAFVPAPGLANAWDLGQIQYGGVSGLTLRIQPPVVMLCAPLGFLPQLNVAPLYRRLLEENAMMAGLAFGIVGDSNSIILLGVRPQEGLDFSELKFLFDQMLSVIMSKVVPLKHQFGF